MSDNGVGQGSPSSVLAGVGDVLRSLIRPGFDLEQVLQIAIERAARLAGADMGNIATRRGDVYRIAAFVGVSEEYERIVRERTYVPERASIVGRALLQLGVVQIADVLEDPEYGLRDAQRAGGFRTLLGVPMIQDGEPLGVLAVGRDTVTPFKDSEIELVSLFADQAAIAIRIATLLTETREALERETAVSIENVRLFQTVERQRTELARFAPQVASLLSSEQGEQLLAGHRREVTALFADLRGFTAFAENAEPEEVLGVLREYHGVAGELVVRNGGTVEHFAGDGLMAFFNDPARVPDHQLVAVRTAVELRERFASLAGQWRKRGYELGLGIGVAVGYATLGRIGFEGRYDYGAVGNVVIVASRLSDAAATAEILISQRLHAAIEDEFEAEPVPDLELKGFSRPVPAFRVVGALPA